MYVWEETYVTRAFDPWTAISLVIVAVMAHGVWRLWRGMKLDAFQRGLRTLRDRPMTSIVFPKFRSAPAPRTGFFQISLLPLTLISSGIAMLLAQAQRPDDLSRPLTWALFVGVGTWYGIRAWPERRGVGPLRNYAWAGACSATLLSALLWAFYLAVDWWWGDGVGRLNSTFSVLLWWTALGAAVGGLIGAFRSNLVYSRARSESSPETSPATTSLAALAIVATPRRRKLAVGTIVMACFASLLLHCSAVPHLNRVVEFRWYWHNHHVHGPSNTITLVSLPAPIDDRRAVAIQIDYTMDQLPDTREVVPSALTRTPQPPLRDTSPDILVATLTRSVGANVRITADMVAMVALRAYSYTPANSIQDSNRVVGRFTTQPLKAGEVVLESQIVQRDLPNLGTRNAAIQLTQTAEASLGVIIEDQVEVELTIASLPAVASTVVSQVGGAQPTLPSTQPAVARRFSRRGRLFATTNPPGAGQTPPTSQGEQIEAIVTQPALLPQQARLKSDLDLAGSRSPTSETTSGDGIDIPNDLNQAVAPVPTPTAEVVRTIRTLSANSDDGGVVPFGSQPSPPRAVSPGGSPASGNGPNSQPAVRAANRGIVCVFKTDGSVVFGALLESNATQLKLQTKQGVVVVRRVDIDRIRTKTRSVQARPAARPAAGR